VYKVFSCIVIVLNLLTITLGMMSTLVLLIFTCVLCSKFVYLCISYQGCHCFVTTTFDAVDFCYVCDDVFIWLLYGLGSSVSVVLLYFIVMSLIT
jgi:hypothetical protein